MATTAIIASRAPSPAHFYHAAGGRRNILDFELDEPPSYNDAERAPTYSRDAPRDEGRQLDGSALVCSLRHLSRKRQAFVSMGPPLNIARDSNRFTEVDLSMTLRHLDSDLAHPWVSTSRQFIIEHKTGAGFSKTKPDFVVVVADREQRTGSFPPARRRSSLFRMTTTRHATPEREDIRHGSMAAPGEAARQSQPIASVRFARSGPLPWTPRATIIYEPAFINLFGHEGHDHIEDRKQDMELRRADANGWTISIFNRDYIWCLLASPNRLALIDLNSESEKASFIYSEVGAFADKGGEIGRLSVPLQSLPSSANLHAGRCGLDDGFMEHIICSLSAAVVHWRNEGKAIYNASRSRPPDIVGDR